VSEQDDPDVIEQAPRYAGFPGLPWLAAGKWTPAGKRPGSLTAAVVACVLLAAAGTFAALSLTSTGPADPDLGRLITEVTTVPVDTAAPAGFISGAAGPPATPPSPAGAPAYAPNTVTGPGAPASVSGPPLTDAGKPEVLYVATGYCPYCAAENWALIVALSRFGQFTGLTTSRSPQFEDVPPIDTWSFYGSSYTSRYLAFVPVETRSNVLVSPKANKGDAASYRVLQRLTAAEQAVFGKYDNHGSTPFIDFADQAVQTGSGILANLVAGNTWQQLAGDLRHPETLEGATLLNEADTLTAELCSLTGGRPAAACPQSPGPAPPGR
jgi:uncharacterized protein DUF929